MRFPWRCLLVVAALVAGCLVVAACGGGEEEEKATPTVTAVPSATATPGPRLTLPTQEGSVQGLPPSAVLRAGDALQTGALGTFCWTWGCSDPFAVVVPAEPLAVPTGESLIFELGFDPTELHMVLWRSNQGEVVRESSDDAFAWQAWLWSEEPVLEETPPPGRTIELRHDLPPGTYIVHFGARAAGGSAAYGFHLEIVP